MIKQITRAGRQIKNDKVTGPHNISAKTQKSEIEVTAVSYHILIERTSTSKLERAILQ